MGRILVEEVRDGSRRTLPSKTHVDINTMIVREVEIRSVPNVMCERRVTYLSSERDVSRHLFETQTHLRVVFVDRHQSLCIAWVPTTDQTSPASAGIDCPPLWFLMSLPARTRRGLDTDRWTRRMTLRDANAFGPDPPFLLATAAIATHTNFEVFLAAATTPHLIWTLCSEFQQMFASSSLRGRMDLRFGRSVQFLDFDVVRFVGTTDGIFETIRRIYGPNVKFTLHPGKAQVKIPSPLVEV